MLGLGKTISGGTLVNNAALQIPNCILHLRSDLGVVLNSSNQVTRWEDQSGRGNHAVSIGLNETPPTITKAALNGNNVITFTAASSNALAVPAGGNDDLTIGLSNSLAFSIFAVWNWVGSEGAGFQCVINTAPNGSWSNNWGLNNGSGSAGDFRFWEGNNYNVVGPPPSFISVATAGNLNYRCSVGTININTTINLYDNGVRSSATARSPFSLSSSRAVIGAYTSAPSTIAGFLDGHIAEIAVYNRDLSAVEAEQLHQYSVRRYGTP